jgi:hypothetical protein
MTGDSECLGEGEGGIVSTRRSGGRARRRRHAESVPARWRARTDAVATII